MKKGILVLFVFLSIFAVSSSLASAAWYDFFTGLVTSPTYVCTDSDASAGNYTQQSFIPGTVVYGYGNKSWNRTDYCFSNAKQVYEMYCNKYNKVSTISVKCAEGCDKSTGACKKTNPVAVCTDSDGGKDYDVKGTTKGYLYNGPVNPPTPIVIVDSCEGNILHETFCDGIMAVTDNGYLCPNGCKDGACVNNSFLPEKCTMPSGLACLDMVQTGNLINVVLQNSVGFDMQDISIKIADENDICDVSLVTYGNNYSSVNSPVLTNGQRSTYRIYCDVKNGTLKGTVYFDYTSVQTGIRHTAQGELIMKLKEQSCPTPYHVNNYGNCVWSCSEGTTPADPTNIRAECICKPGYVQTGWDSLGRKVCSITTNNTCTKQGNSCCLNGFCRESACPLGSVYVLIGCTANCINEGYCRMTMSSCTDSDGGINYYVKGTASGINANGNFTATDSCGGLNYSSINEVYCNGSEAKSINYKCPNGCKDGACISSPVNIRETVRCVFNNSKTTQACYSSTGVNCSGIGYCYAYVNGTTGTQVTWKSTCGGYAYTKMDGISESANFYCTAPILTNQTIRI